MTLKPRNAIRNRRAAQGPAFDTRFQPDLQPPIHAEPGFPPDTDGFCVSTFAGRFALQTDFQALINNQTILNAPDDLNYDPTPDSLIGGVYAPDGFRLIVRHVFFNFGAIGLIQGGGGDNTEQPLTYPGGSTNTPPDVYWPIPRLRMNGAPIEDISILPIDNNFGGRGATFLAYQPLSIDCYIRVESGSFVTLDMLENAIGAAGTDSFVTINSGAYVEFRGQIEAVDNYELQTLGLTKEPVPVSEKEGQRLLNKRREGKT